jgi:hypothetical protein
MLLWPMVPAWSHRSQYGGCKEEESRCLCPAGRETGKDGWEKESGCDAEVRPRRRVRPLLRRKIAAAPKAAARPKDFAMPRAATLPKAAAA